MTKDRLPALKAVNIIIYFIFLSKLPTINLQAQGEADEDEVHLNLDSTVFMEEFFNQVYHMT